MLFTKVVHAYTSGLSHPEVSSTWEAILVCYFLNKYPLHDQLPCVWTATYEVDTKVISVNN